jgi:hypothetical protein
MDFSTSIESAHLTFRQDTGFYFDTSDPYRPKFLKSNRGLLASIADEVRAKPDGGFFITYMGSAVGTSPGRLIETDKDFNIIHEWPEDVDGLLNILGEQFSPHGLSIDWEKKLILTSDFVEPISILKPTLGVRRANTLRLWDLDSRTILSTLTIPNVSQALTRGCYTFTNVAIGWWYSRCQVHPRTPRVRRHRHRCAPWSTLDYLPSAQGRERQPGCDQGALRPRPQGS